MTNPLVNVLTPKVRAIVYALAFLASLAYGAWTGSGGDWNKAIPAFLASLLWATAASNASPTPVKPDKPGKHERGAVDIGLLFIVLTFVGVVLLLFRVHF